MMKVWAGVVILPALLLAEQQGSLGTSAVVARGDQLFAQGCAVGYCHGTAGAAARSPRLRGRVFERDYLVKVIRDGIPNTAMPAWGDRLTDGDISALVAYIQSLATASSEGPAPAEAASAAPPVAVKESELSPEVRQGRELFYDAQRAQRCSNCHRLQGMGTAVSADLAKLSKQQLGAEAVTAVRNARARRVQEVALKSGDRFPAVVLDRGPAVTRVYDLKSTPPVLRQLENSEIQVIQTQRAWRHAQAVRGYTADELRAVWAFVDWAAQR
ncbi:MAG: c-type cytochrome [Acidobacteriota bacterium]|jgi:mono/diheme cytochrome c family protein|nr:c-type cytochrome [Bryobacteraceae bacterium CoA2 C42]MCA2962919.1 c-type cytochrome [Acidobacteriaceae bacterium]